MWFEKFVSLCNNGGNLFVGIVYNASCCEGRDAFLSDCNCSEIKAVNWAAEDENSPAIGYQRADVCAQVTVEPFAKTGITITKCCGDPVVTSGDVPCGGRKDGVCTFTISKQYSPKYLSSLAQRQLLETLVSIA